MLATFKSEVLEGLNGVRTELEEVRKSSDSLKDRLTTVEEVAKSADEAVRGTVSGGGNNNMDESIGNHSRTMKSGDAKDDDIWAGVLDEVIPN